MERESLIKTIFRRLKKRVSPKMLIILIITLSVNTFAWFIYANKVEGGIEARIKAWNISFQVDGGDISESVTIDVDQLYPGRSFSKDVTIYNSGDTDAELAYEISSMTIFGITNRFNETDNLNVNTLLANIQQDYPFIITPTFSNTLLRSHSSQTFNFSINWPFESGDDEKDTLWGERAYNYASLHPNDPSMQMTIKILAKQVLNGE